MLLWEQVVQHMEVISRAALRRPVASQPCRGLAQAGDRAGLGLGLGLWASPGCLGMGLVGADLTVQCWVQVRWGDMMSKVLLNTAGRETDVLGR